MNTDQTPVIDISQLDGTFTARQVAAGVILATVIALISWRMKRKAAATGTSKPVGVLVGGDGRVSTSITVATLWTVVIGYCLLTLVFIALGPVSTDQPTPIGSIPPNFVDAAFLPIDIAYLSLLFPALALVAAKLIYERGKATGDVQKTEATDTSLLDAVLDDQGSVDLGDAQYVFFNAIAAIFVITQFAMHPARGLPSIPQALAVLIAASAVVYTGNRAVAKNPPQVQQILSAQTAAGREIVLLGNNLAVNAAAATPSDVAKATTVVLSAPGRTSPPAIRANRASSGRVSFTVPPTIEDGTWDGVVVTNAGGKAAFHGLDVTAGAIGVLLDGS